MQISTDGIVLKQRKISGNRRIIVLFTRQYGKINAGTGINERGRSKSALALRPFTYAEYDIYKNKDYYNIDNASVKKSYYSIGEDLDKYFVASAMIDYLNSILEEGQARTKLFDMSIEFMDALSESRVDPKTMFYSFIVKTFPLLGIMPEIKCCVNCGRRYDKDDKNQSMKLRTFSVTSGGMLCDECVNDDPKASVSLIFKPSFDIVETLNFLLDNPFSTFERIEIKPVEGQQLRRMLSDYLIYYLNIDVLENDTFNAAY